MTNLSSPFFMELMQNKDICCFFCDVQGIIIQCGRGISMRYPNIFSVGADLKQLLPTADTFQDLIYQLQQENFFITPSFYLAENEYFLCCFSYIEDLSGKQKIFCKLETGNYDAPNFKKNMEYYNLMEAYNTDILVKIAEGCRNMQSIAQAEQIARMSEAVLRNNLLLEVSHSILRTGSEEESVLLKPVCLFFQNQINASIHSPGKGLSIYPEIMSDRPFYLDVSHFFEAMIALISIYQIDHALPRLDFRINEKGGNVFIRVIGNGCNQPETVHQKTLIGLLENIINSFCRHYNGKMSCMAHNQAKIITMNFKLQVSHEPVSDGRFRNQKRIYSLDHLLTILRFADR